MSNLKWLVMSKKLLEVINNYHKAFFKGFVLLTALSMLVGLSFEDFWFRVFDTVFSLAFLLLAVVVDKRIDKDIGKETSQNSLNQN
jgi:hypothetical protein